MSKFLDKLAIIGFIGVFIVATIHWIQFGKYNLFIECLIGLCVVILLRYKRRKNA